MGKMIGIGLGTTSCCVAVGIVGQGTLAAVRLIAPQLRRPIGIIHRHRKVFTPSVTKFIELLQEIQQPAPEES